MAKKKKKKDTYPWSTILSIVAIAISVGSLYISYSESEKNDEERIIVRASPRVPNLPIRVSSMKMGKQGGVVHVPYHITISNVGRPSVSLITHDCKQADKDGKATIFYSGIEGGLVSTAGKPMSLSLNIGSGETQAVIFYLGIRAPKNVMDLLGGSSSPTLTRREAVRLLGEAGIGLYGQPVEYKSYGGAGISISQTDGYEMLPVYLSTWKSGAGNRFNTLVGETVGLFD